MFNIKQILVTLIACFLSFSLYAQAPVAHPEESWTLKDTLTVGYLERIAQHTAPCYKLYPTENMWTFLELETFSGRIWQVQYSTKGPEYRFKTALNEDSMLPYLDEDGGFAGRFELHKTQNMYNFILLDTETGSTWQVQWGMEPEERMVMRIW